MHDDVLDAAMRLFWEKGVDHVTLDDLEAAAGVDRSTLYNSFDGKAGLYRDAAARYSERTIEWLFGPGDDAERPDAGLAVVFTMIERLRDMIESAVNPTGCLIVNDVSTPSIDAEAARTYLDALHSQTQAALARAADDGDIEQSGIAELTGLVVAGVLGANVASRAIGRDDAVRGLDALVAAVERARMRRPRDRSATER